MKKIFYTFLLISPLLFIYSCDKDGDSGDTDNNTPTNYVLYDGNYYEMDGPCIIEDYGQWEGDIETYNFDINIGNSNFYDNNNPGFDQYDTTMSSHILYFELFTSESMLNDGVYNFDSEATYNSMTFDWGDFVVWATGSTFNNVPTIDVSVTGGSVNINVNNSYSSITVDVECTTNENKSISAHWEGDFNYYDTSKLINPSEELKKNKPITLIK